MRLQLLITEVVTREIAGLVVLDQHVRSSGEPAGHLLAFGLGNVERHRLLTAIGAEEIRGFARVVAVAIFQVGRPPAARVVAYARSLDLDHFRAEIGQDLTAPGPREHAAHIEYANV